MAKLTTVTQVIAALDGEEAVAKLLGYKSSRNTIGHWEKQGSLPSKTYLVLTTELKKRGKSAPISLWRMVEPVEQAGAGA